MVAFVVALVAVADRRPRGAHTRTAAREQHIIVQLVLLDGWATTTHEPARGGALHRDNDSRVVWSREDVSAEPVGIWLPSKRQGLRGVRRALE